MPSFKFNYFPSKVPFNLHTQMSENHAKNAEQPETGVLKMLTF
jgi:hypothetical protein